MIRSIRDRASERLSMGEIVRRFSGVGKQAVRKIGMLHQARDLGDLGAPLAGRLEALAGDRRGQHSIRINDQWRVCFKWTKEGLIMSKSPTPIKGVPTPNRVTTHPGEILAEEFLKPLGLSGNALAMALRVPTTRIGAIIKGERSVTADTALRLARFFGTSPEFWVNLQAMHDLTKARLETGTTIERDVQPRAA
jgi:addiction module HigA family antidote